MIPVRTDDRRSDLFARRMEWSVRPILVLMTVVSLAICDESPDARLAELKKSLPTAETSLQDRISWLWDCSVRCDQDRKYAEAEAYMAGVIAIMPDNGHALGSLACYIGKQGRYPEALDITNAALEKKANNRIQLLGIKATWFAHLGDKAQAEKIWIELAVPDAGHADEYAMYWVCRAFYLARIESSEEGVKEAIGHVIGSAGSSEHWRGFFKNDVSFDAFRDRTWFRAMLP